MRILIVNTYYYPEIVGGAEYSVKKLAEELKAQGNDVFVLCTGDQNYAEFIDGVKIIRFKPFTPSRKSVGHDLNAFTKLFRRFTDIYNIFNRKSLKKIIDNINPDVIHTNGLYSITPIIWKIAHENNIRVVHTLRDYYLICPLVDYSCEKSKHKCKYKNNLCKLHKHINRINSKYVDCVTAPSLITLNKVCNQNFFVDSKKIVIPNAIDYNQNSVERLYSDKVSQRNKFEIKFIYLGTLSEKKGIKWLLDSFNQFSLKNINVKLYIAGKGELENFIRKNKDNRIEFLGFLNEDKLNTVLKNMDVLICPSLWDEPFGRVVLDAYKNAMPVISSNRGALPSLVKNGKTGRVVKANDIDDLLAAMKYYCIDIEHINKDAWNAINELSKYSLSEQAKTFLGEAYYRGELKDEKS